MASVFIVFGQKPWAIIIIVHGLIFVSPKWCYRLCIDHPMAITVAVCCRNVSEELSEEGNQVGAAVATAQNKIISQVAFIYHYKYIESVVVLL